MLELQVEQDKADAARSKHEAQNAAQREAELRKAALQKAIDTLEAYQRSDPANVNDIRALKAARKAVKAWLDLEK
jgi:hypothetical protein